MRLALVLLATLLGAAVPALAQDVLPDEPRRRGPIQSQFHVFVGGGLGPGAGGVAVVSDTFLGLTLREAAVYLDYTPRVAGGSGRLLTSVGVGGGVRVLRVAAIALDEDLGRFDLDAGLRIGPSFYTAFFDQTAASEARAFGIFTDTWARGSMRLARGAVVFAEVGSQAPALRGGLAFPLK